MKTIFRSLLLAASAYVLVPPARAQSTIPNANFETWGPRNGIEAPMNWLTIDDLFQVITGAQLATGTVTKTTVAHAGAFAAELQTKSVNGQVIPGALILGTSFGNLSQTGLLGGVPFMARPVNAQFYYQLLGPNAVADMPGIKVSLNKRINGITTVVGGGAYVFQSAATNYTLVTIPLQYNSALTPDSVKIEIVSGNATQSTPGTTLRIDDISFAGIATATRAAPATTALSAYPNPSPDGRFTLLLSAPAAAVEVRVLDALGREVARHAWSGAPRSRCALDLSAQPAGLYTVSVQTAAGRVAQRVSIR